MFKLYVNENSPPGAMDVADRRPPTGEGEMRIVCRRARNGNCLIPTVLQTTNREICTSLTT